MFVSWTPKAVQVWTELCNFVRWLIFHAGPRPAPQQHGPGPWYDDRGILHLHYICNPAVNTSIRQIFVEVRHRTAEGGGSLLFVHMYDNVRTGLMYTWIHTLHYVETLWQYFQYCPRHYRLQRRGSFPLDVGIVECWDVGMLGCTFTFYPTYRGSRGARGGLVTPPSSDDGSCVTFQLWISEISQPSYTTPCLLLPLHGPRVCEMVRQWWWPLPLYNAATVGENNDTALQLIIMTQGCLPTQP